MRFKHLLILISVCRKMNMKILLYSRDYLPLKSALEPASASNFDGVELFGIFDRCSVWAFLPFRIVHKHALYIHEFVVITDSDSLL